MVYLFQRFALTTRRAINGDIGGDNPFPRQNPTMKRARILLRNAFFVGAAIASCCGCNRKADKVTRTETTDKTKPSVAAVRGIAEEGYIYGLPIVMNYAVMYDFCVNRDSGQYKAPFNVLTNEARVFTYKDTAIVTPNSDTPYSFVWMDLRAEPIVLTVPAVDKDRYYSVQLCDGNTFNYGYIGTRATEGKAGNFLVVGPDWKGETPDGIREVFHSSTQFSAAFYRTQLFNAADMPNVVTIQAGYKAQPLSKFLNQPAPPAAPAIDFPKIDKNLMRENFFEYLDFALQFAPAGLEEKKSARIWPGSASALPEKHSTGQDLSPGAQGGGGRSAMKDGDQKIDRQINEGEKKINGWTVGAYFGDRAFFGANWLKRAAAAKAGIYGNDAAEAVYPITKTLGNGDPLDCRKHDYTLTFPAGELPPVNAFWSVTMNDCKTQLLIRNSIDRYLINSPMLPDMKKNKAGSLTIYIQRDSPGKEHESNWLPAADGPIYLVMRLYWPEVRRPSILPPGDGSWKPPAVVKVK